MFLLILILWWWRGEAHIDIMLPLRPGALRHQEVELHGLADHDMREVEAMLQAGLKDDVHLTRWCLFINLSSLWSPEYS